MNDVTAFFIRGWKEHFPEVAAMPVPVYKILLVGDANVGKSSLIRRLLLGEFDPDYTATVGVDLSAAALNLDESTPVILTLIDLGGQADFSALRSQYYRGAHLAAFVYDISNRESFEHLPFWHKGVMENVTTVDGKAVLAMLIGNKSDRADKREVSAEEGANFAEGLGIPFMETSAKTGENVETTFTEIARMALERYPPPRMPRDRLD